VTLESYHLTDLGNAKRFVRDHGQAVRFCPPRKCWYSWNGKYWELDECGIVIRQAKATALSIYSEVAGCEDDDRRKAIVKHALASERAAGITNILLLAQSEAGIPILPTAFDTDPWLFNCQNGTLDLRSGALKEHQRADLISKIAPVGFDADARSELWDSYIETATNGDADLARYIQVAVGYSMQGTVSERAFFFAHGPPASTKSTFIETIAAAFGTYHQSAAFETWLVQTSTGGNRGDLARLTGARLVTSVEVRKGAKFDEGLLKRVAGGDPVTAAAKYEKEFTFSPAFTLWLAANDKPVIRDDDDGTWSRLKPLPFVHVIPPEKQDRTMRQRLKEPDVLKAVLAWAVQGCLAWQRDGLSKCTAVETSIAEYQTEMDRAAGFFEEHCVFAPSLRVNTTELVKAYEAWCEQNGCKPLRTNELAQRLTTRGCAKGKSGSTRYWNGVRLVDDLFDKTGTPGTARDGCSRELVTHALVGGSSGNRCPQVSQVSQDDWEAEEAWRNEG
jgi:putative DNA primase/helicase